MTRRLEVCVDTIQSAINAVAGGADRIELCSALSEGGLTPSFGLMRSAVQLSIPVYAMIRPRSGHFNFSQADEHIMHSDIRAARDVGVAGVVLGAQGETDDLDVALLSRLIGSAQGLKLSLHRVIDIVADPMRALDQAIDLGFERVLTSGAAAQAIDGIDLIARMVAQSQGRISVMPGSGVSPDNVREIIRATGVCELHASCAVPIIEPAFSNFAPQGGRKETSVEHVRALVHAIQD